jgi:hypothetical protein
MGQVVFLVFRFFFITDIPLMYTVIFHSSATKTIIFNKKKTGKRSCNHCCSGKSVRITYSEDVSVALVIIQYVTRMCHIVICGLSGLYNIFPH